MSINTIERIFWEFGAEPDKAKAYLKDPDGYLAKFPLTDAERAMVRSMDVQALDAHGVSHMLIMSTFSLVHGGGDLLLFEYLKQLNGGKMINRMKLPGWQFKGLSFALGVRNAWIKAQRFLRLKKQTG